MQDDFIIYETDSKKEIKIQLQQEEIWLDTKSIADLFDVQRPAIVKHVNNIYKSEELQKKGTCSILEQVAKDGKMRKMNYYNLDMIISLGYRVNSLKGTKFRIWANMIVKEKLESNALKKSIGKAELSKYKELVNMIDIADVALEEREDVNVSEAKGIISLIKDYALALDTLDQYDHQALLVDGERDHQVNRIDYKLAKSLINEWKKEQKTTPLFGNEKDDSLKSSLHTIYQTIDLKDVYPTIEEKAAQLLFFLTKNHSFSDGNKRIAAGLFLYFLDINSILYNQDGSKRIGDNALVAITIMIASSKPEEKDVMTTLIVNLINKNNL